MSVFSGILWTGFIRVWLPLVTNNKIDPQYWLNCKLTISLHFLVVSISSAMLVVMSVEKCFVLYFPLKAKCLCTVDRAKRVTLATLVVILLFNSQWIFTASPVEVRGQRQIGCKVAFKFQRHLVTFVNFVIPEVVMVTCNCAILIKLFKRQEGKAARQATFMILSVTSLFIIFTFPLQIFYSPLGMR